MPIEKKILFTMLLFVSFQYIHCYNIVLNMKDGSEITGVLLSINSGNIYIDPDGPATLKLVYERDISKIFVKDLNININVPITQNDLPEQIKPLYNTNITFNSSNLNSNLNKTTNTISKNLCVGLLYGTASSITTEAIDGFSMTKFEKGNIFGGCVMLVSNTGFGCELLIENYEQDLDEEGINLGVLKSNPVLLLFKYHSIPWQNKGLTYSFDIGGGINHTSFDKGNYLREIEQSLGVKYKITTENAFVFEMGLGIGYFFSKNVSISFDWKLLAGNVKTKWAVENVLIDDIDLFYVSNSQPMLILRYWFR